MDPLLHAIAIATVQEPLESGHARDRIARLAKELIDKGLADQIKQPKTLCATAKTIVTDQFGEDWDKAVETHPIMAYLALDIEARYACENGKIIPEPAPEAASVSEGSPPVAREADPAELDDAALCHAAYSYLPTRAQYDASQPYRTEALARGLGESKCAIIHPAKLDAPPEPEDVAACEATAIAPLLLPDRQAIGRLAQSLSDYNATHPKSAEDAELLDISLALVEAAQGGDNGKLAHGWKDFEAALSKRSALKRHLQASGALSVYPLLDRMKAEIALMEDILRSHASRNLTSPAAKDWRFLLQRANAAPRTRDPMILRDLSSALAATLTAAGLDTDMQARRKSACEGGKTLLCQN